MRDLAPLKAAGFLIESRYGVTHLDCINGFSVDNRSGWKTLINYPQTHGGRPLPDRLGAPHERIDRCDLAARTGRQVTAPQLGYVKCGDRPLGRIAGDKVVTHTVPGERDGQLPDQLGPVRDHARCARLALDEVAERHRLATTGVEPHEHVAMPGSPGIAHIGDELLLVGPKLRRHSPPSW